MRALINFSFDNRYRLKVEERDNFWVLLGSGVSSPLLYLRDLRFSQPCFWAFSSSGKWCVVGWVVPDVSKDRLAFMFKGQGAWQMKGLYTFEKAGIPHPTQPHNNPEDLNSYVCTALSRRSTMVKQNKPRYCTKRIRTCCQSLIFLGGGGGPGIALLSISKSCVLLLTFLHSLIWQ